MVLGGQDPEITIFWGNEDAGQVTDINSTSAGWDYAIPLGTRSLGAFEHTLSALATGESYFYRLWQKMQQVSHGLR